MANSETEPRNPAPEMMFDYQMGVGGYKWTVEFKFFLVAEWKLQWVLKFKRIPQCSDSHQQLFQECPCVSEYTAVTQLSKDEKEKKKKQVHMC